MKTDCKSLELHKSKLKLRAVARLWVKWNRRELPGDEFAHAVGKILKKETQREWDRNIGLELQKDYPDISIKTLEDLLV